MSSALSLSVGFPPYPGLPERPDWWYALDQESYVGGSIVTELIDRSGNGRNLISIGEPTLSLIGSVPFVNLDGIDDRFDSGASNNVPVNGFSRYTIGIVSICEDASYTQQDPPRNCLVFFNEFTGWGIVNVSPYQAVVMARYGTGQGDNLPFWTRSNILTTTTSTVWAKNGSTDRLYVDGNLVAVFSDKLPTIANTTNRLNVGYTNPTNTFYKGKFTELIGYAGVDCAEDLANYLKNKYSL